MLAVCIKTTKFSFWPGHRSYLLELPGLVPQYIKLIETKSSAIDISNHEAFFSSSILKEMINTALKNFGKTPNNYRYSKILIDFGI